MKYKKIAECPPLLEEVIEISNLVPRGDENFLPDAVSLIDDFYFNKTGNYPRIERPNNDRGGWKPMTYDELEIYEESQEEAQRHIEKTTRKFPKLHDFLFGNYNYQNLEVRNYFSSFAILPMIDIGETLRKYNEVLRLNNQLRAVTKDCEYYVKTKTFPTATNRFFTTQRTSQRSFQTIFLITKEEKITFQDDLFIKVLEGINAKRLRICPICKDIFWVKRIEAGTCSKKRCSNNFHQRKLRIKEYESNVEKEFKKLEKHQAEFGLEHPLTTKQIEKVNKILLKINTEKLKNGTL